MAGNREVVGVKTAKDEAGGRGTGAGTLVMGEGVVPGKFREGIDRILSGLPVSRIRHRQTAPAFSPNRTKTEWGTLTAIAECVRAIALAYANRS
jgi:hypothetical protein